MIYWFFLLLLVVTETTVEEQKDDRGPPKKPIPAPASFYHEPDPRLHMTAQLRERIVGFIPKLKSGKQWKVHYEGCVLDL